MRKPFRFGRRIVRFSEILDEESPHGYGRKNSDESVGRTDKCGRLRNLPILTVMPSDGSGKGAKGNVASP